jgi:hypothetical protein
MLPVGGLTVRRWTSEVACSQEKSGGLHMKWTLGVAAAVLALAGSLHAAEVYPEAYRASPAPRGPLNAAANWWAKFGEPVNQEEIAAAPAEALIQPVGHHGYGYVYGPGSCDYTPPCTGWQWNDYNPMPWRCYPHYLRKQHRWGKGGCDTCGDSSCNACDTCGHKHGWLHAMFHKHHGCGCDAAVECGAKVPDCAAPTCAAPSCAAVPTCEAVPDCGCDAEPACGRKKLFHCHWHWKKGGFWNKHCGCDTCAPACGCEGPVMEMPKGEMAPMPMPIPEESTKAAMYSGNTNSENSLVWPFSPVR